MSNLLASLASSGNALQVFQQALDVVQNNVSNASTPGFAKQRLNLAAQPLDIAGGLAGGVGARGLESSRDEYAEEEVRRQLQSLGQYTAQSQATGTIQNLFDVTGSSGIPAALSNLFQSFSAWSVTPNDPSARQSVLVNAGAFADSVRGMASSLSKSSQQLDGQIHSTVDQINALAQQIQKYNVQRLREPQSDPGADAQLHSNLESLAQLANITTVTQTDGTVTVLVGGGSPLVVGDHQYAVSAQMSVNSQPAPVNPQSPPSAHILDSEGKDITAQVAGGQLGGLLDVRNRVLGGILGDGQKPGSLNDFAKGIADTVNQILQTGTVSSTPGAANGAALFTYDTSDATRAASSMTINPAITADQLAAVDSTGGANGNAVQLAALANATGSQGTIGGMSYVQFFAQIAADVGQENQTAQTNEQTQQHVTAQARTLRDQISAVSLDQEAIHLVEFQRSYQAAARVISVLSDLTATAVNIIQG